VVGAARAVLPDGSAELGHRQHDHVLHARRAEVCDERVDALRELREQVRQLTAGAAFGAVRVPAAHVREGDFQPDARLYQLRYLHQRVPERPARVLRAVLGPVLRGVHPLQKVDGLEGLLARAAQNVVHALLVDALESALHGGGRSARTQLEVGEALHRERGRAALHRARQVLRQRYRAERSGLRVGPRLQCPVEPAVLRGLDARRRGLHVVLRVEVRARVVGRADGVNDREPLLVPQRLERRE